MAVNAPRSTGAEGDTGSKAREVEPADPALGRRHRPGPGWRVVAAVLATVALAALATGYLVVSGGRSGSTSAAAPAGSGTGTGGTDRPRVDGLDLSVGSGLLFVDKTLGPHYGRLGFLPDDAALPRQESDLDCERVYTEQARVLCLRSTGSAVPSYSAVVLDDHLTLQQTVKLAGLPSRARLSADGTIASWTVFVSGDSYLAVGFSTRTSLLDLRSGELIASLEDFSIVKDGSPYRSPDVNLWGVTVAADDRTFYATMATRGRTYLVRGDRQARTLTTLADNVECPSLSPDNTRLVFKKRVDADGGRRPWRLWVLDLATLHQAPLAEDRSVDDQAAWLDDRTVAYSLPVEMTSSYDVWSVPADGSGTPALRIGGASSPTPVKH